MTQPNFRIYLKQMGLILAASVILIISALHFIDPYGISGTPTHPDWNQKKPKSARHFAAAKIARAGRMDYATLLLGNSRVDAGLDPLSSSWPDVAMPVFNGGIAGQGVQGNINLILQEDGFRWPETVILGLDFFDFPTASNCSQQVSRDSGTASRLAAGTFLKTHLSLDSLLDAFVTLDAQGDPHADDMRADGFNPWGSIWTAIQSEGQAAIFRQRNFENFRKYATVPKSLTCPDGSYSAQIGALRRLAEQANSREERVLIFVHPYHADILEGIELAGLWPLYEEFKRQLSDLSSAYVAVWDFGAHFAPNVSEVPPPEDTTTVNEWYWEAGHYRSALGDRIISRVLDVQSADSQFGFSLEPENVEAALGTARLLQQRYRENSPNALARVRTTWHAAVSSASPEGPGRH